MKFDKIAFIRKLQKFLSKNSPVFARLIIGSGLIEKKIIQTNPRIEKFNPIIFSNQILILYHIFKYFEFLHC